MEKNLDYLSFIRQLSRMNSEEILAALAEAKTGHDNYQDYLSLEPMATAEGALAAFIAALNAYNANKLIDGALE